MVLLIYLRVSLELAIVLLELAVEALLVKFFLGSLLGLLGQDLGDFLLVVH